MAATVGAVTTEVEGDPNTGPAKDGLAPKKIVAAAGPARATRVVTDGTDVTTPKKPVLPREPPSRTGLSS